MTYAVYLLVSGGLCAASVSLSLRLRTATRFTADHVPVPDAPDPLAAAVARLLTNAIDTSLVPSGDASGLASVEVLSREPQDPYRSLAEVVTRIGAALPGGATSDLGPLVKYLYQFQSTIGACHAELDECLRVLAARVSDAADSDGRGRVEVVRAGDLLDGKRMMALTRGTRVKQPLGFVIISAEGTILSKARVICE